MKTRFYLLAVIMMASITITAQGRNINNEGKRIPSVEQIAKHKAEMMRRELLLGNNQYDKVYKICLKQAKEQVKRMKQIEAERKQMKAEMKGILNEAQYKRFEQMGRRPMPNKDMHRKGMYGKGRNAKFNGRGGFDRNTPPAPFHQAPKMMGERPFKPAPQGGFKPAPEGGFRPAPKKMEPAKGEMKPYGDAKQNKNMYREIQPE